MSNENTSPMDLARSIVETLSIPHTRYQKRRDSVQVSWEPSSTRLNTKKVQKILVGQGFTPVNQDRQIVNQYTKDGNHVFVGPEYGIIVVRTSKVGAGLPTAVSASFEKLRPLDDNEMEHLNVEKPKSGDVLISYDETSEASAVLVLGLDPEENRIRVSIDTFQGNDDTRYFDDTEIGYAAAKKYAEMLATKKYKALPLAAYATMAAATQDSEFDEYDDYDQWLKDIKEQWPDARHNKKGEPDWQQGYGEENDEEFLIGPDMQADVVGVWVTDDKFGWLMRGDGSKSVTAAADQDEIFAEGTSYKQMLGGLLAVLDPHLDPTLVARGTTCQAVYDWDSFDYDSHTLATKLAELGMKEVKVDPDTVHFETTDGRVFVIFSIAVAAAVVGSN